MKLIIGIVFIFTSLQLFAGAPEYLYQVESGKHSFNVDYAYRSYGIDFEDSSQVDGDDWEWNWDYHIIGLHYEWGLNENFSIGAGLDYLSGNLEFTLPGVPGPSRDWNISGIEGIDLNFKGNSDFGFMKLHYGLLADISLGAQKYESHIARDGFVFTGRTDASKGRHEFTPYVAANMESGSRNYGIKFAYQFNTDTKHEFKPDGAAEYEVTYEGGHGIFLSLYYEAMLKDESIFGFAINYLSYQDMEVTEATGGPAVVGEEHKDYEYSTDGFRFDFYGNVKTGISGLDFIPKVSYFLSSDKDHNDQTKDVNGDNGRISSTGGSYMIEFNLRKEF